MFLDKFIRLIASSTLGFFGCVSCSLYCLVACSLSELCGTQGKTQYRTRFTGFSAEYDKWLVAACFVSRAAIDEYEAGIVPPTAQVSAAKVRLLRNVACMDK